MTTGAPPKKRTIGKLAQARRPRSAVIEQHSTPPFYQAIEAADGWTYPTMGEQLMLYVKATAVGTVKMAREVHSASLGTKKLIAYLNKKGDG